ncbi:MULTISPECIES: DoxX family protein [unclassified Aureispira]|uniref:DoxX family protein n=1 Tax=unclassified Aureispira TaxID=2649989 RepID=UPI0006985D2B|nr:MULTISPECIES: DoxX family protein [unclassified Aureispira]WMX14227.1 DoxX family protein [Aureispira sp. CCB-E]
MKKNTDLGLLVLRISIGVLMLLHGIGKLGGGLGFIESVLADKGIPTFIAYGVIVGEVLAPIAILAGFRTRIAAAIYAFNCLVAILLVHMGDIFTLNQHGGWGIELLGLYLFGAVALFFTGAGKYAMSKNNTWD